MADKKVKKPSLWRDVVLPASIIIVAVFSFNFLIYNINLRSLKNSNIAEVVDHGNLIERKFEKALITTSSVAAFFASSNEVTSTEFDNFAIAFDRRISSLNLRVNYGWVDDKNIVKYVYPEKEFGVNIKGFDLNKYPNRLEPIMRAKLIHSEVVTPPIILISGYPGFLIYDPVFKNDKYMGSALLVVRLTDIIGYLKTETHLYAKNMYVKIGDFIIPLNREAIYTPHGERVSNPEGILVKDDDSQEYLPINNDIVRNINLKYGNWELRSKPVYFLEANKLASIFFPASFVFIAIIIYLLFNIHKRQLEISEREGFEDAVIKSMANGLMACDKNGIIILVNVATEKLSGRSDLIGRHCSDVWEMTDAKGNILPNLNGIIDRTLQSGAISNITVAEHLYISGNNGIRFPFSATVAPIIVDNKITGAIAIFRDITKESEVDKMKTEFLSLASHQLLTPVSSNIWISETLLGGYAGPLNEKQEKYVQDIHDSSRRMSDLVAALLNISRIESGRLTIVPEATDLSGLLHEAIKDLNNKINEKGHHLEINIDNDLPKINVDPKLIREVYKNLISNSVKYTQSQGRIAVSVKKKGDYLVSSVSDNGYGIPKEEKDKIFEKFYRGSNIISLEKDGNGLGLYLVKEIIEVSGGTIGFESSIGKGTTFWFNLPITGSTAKYGQVSLATSSS